MNVREDELKWVNLLAEIRWPGGFRCACGETRHYRSERRLRVFECAGCGRQQSVTAGTVMHRTRVPLEHWFLAAAMLAEPDGVAASVFATTVGVHVETAWQILHRLRHVLPSEPDATFDGMVEAMFSSTPCRLPRGVRGHGEPDRVPLVVMYERQLPPRVSIVVAEVRDWDAVVIARVDGPVVVAGPLGQRLKRAPRCHGDIRATIRLNRQLQAFLGCTHQSVSRAWLRRYLREFIARFELGTPELSARLLTRALRAPTIRFVDLAACAHAAI